MDQVLIVFPIHYTTTPVFFTPLVFFVVTDHVHFSFVGTLYSIWICNRYCSTSGTCEIGVYHLCVVTLCLCIMPLYKEITLPFSVIKQETAVPEMK